MTMLPPAPWLRGLSFTGFGCGGGFGSFDGFSVPMTGVWLPLFGFSVPMTGVWLPLSGFSVPMTGVWLLLFGFSVPMMLLASASFCD